MAQGVPVRGRGGRFFNHRSKNRPPLGVAGINPTTILDRRVKQGVAEWYRLQVRQKAWQGLREHALAGWNIGKPPYGYAAQRFPHPVPMKAAQGATKTRLVLDPVRAPVVAQIFTWRAIEKDGIGVITNRLNADHDAYPPPKGDTWTMHGVYAILQNPKYTGHMVWNRSTYKNHHRRLNPPEQWVWSPDPSIRRSSPGSSRCGRSGWRSPTAPGSAPLSPGPCRAGTPRWTG